MATEWSMFPRGVARSPSSFCQNFQIVLQGKMGSGQLRTLSDCQWSIHSDPSSMALGPFFCFSPWHANEREKDEEVGLPINKYEPESIFTNLWCHYQIFGAISALFSNLTHKRWQGPNNNQLGPCASSPCLFLSILLASLFTQPWQICTTSMVTFFVVHHILHVLTMPLQIPC